MMPVVIPTSRPVVGAARAPILIIPVTAIAVTGAIRRAVRAVIASAAITITRAIRHTVRAVIANAAITIARAVRGAVRAVVAGNRVVRLPVVGLVVAAQAQEGRRTLLNGVADRH